MAFPVDRTLFEMNSGTRRSEKPDLTWALTGRGNTEASPERQPRNARKTGGNAGESCIPAMQHRHPQKVGSGFGALGKRIG